MAAAREQRQQIDAMLASGVLNADLTNAAAEAARWLPEGVTQQVELPQVYVILFEPQGFGRPREIVIDALYTMQKGEGENVEFLGHELHHSYRETLRRLTWADGAEPLMQQLDRIVHEGTASMIDKAPRYRAAVVPIGESEDFLQLIRDTPQRLAQNDAALAGLTPTAEGYAAAANLVDEASPGGGHLNGVFMAMTIEDQLGRQALIDALSGPVVFFDAYQRAARSGGQFVFSDAAIRNLERAADEAS